MYVILLILSLQLLNPKNVMSKVTVKKMKFLNFWGVEFKKM